jgi:hypothetical protein
MRVMEMSIRRRGRVGRVRLTRRHGTRLLTPTRSFRVGGAWRSGRVWWGSFGIHHHVEDGDF